MAEYEEEEKEEEEEEEGGEEERKNLAVPLKVRARAYVAVITPPSLVSYMCISS